MDIVLATGNAGKVAELQQLLQASPSTAHWRIKPQSQWNFEEAVEDGLSFVENAIIKARHACQHTGLAAIADDSGIAVDALQGAPGIYSARYAGEPRSDQRNIDKLLATLAQQGIENASASFHCALVMLRHAEDPTPIICQGRWQGTLLSAPRGSGGFGYDPIFWDAETQCSAAELSREQKQQRSHRGKALQQLLAQLAEQPL
ncbi:non-canonical purine NTP pyrophosphatase, RdgB/HAM1 family [Idiomarina tyrosinivorans]|uniref:dITP/XTP pyrophosphatase n=1 Tax=Idiomarina tyrosinivorans TaxID=1445662 RepID=A0A432ZJS9_9GAMM|nr:RdgB/HAM1 family non-canonical purine NTP pyrophosphatase [Idiomarina tyrosinivorans]RUO78173.1 non-canonical purine NTP pyrophosphatase, RdgB/HAM1 family [Idiomarina tyrosinivorans]